MYHKNFIVWIQYPFNKFFPIDDLYSFRDRQGVCSRMDPPGKVSLCKPYVCITEGQERHFKNYIHLYVSYQEGLLKKSNLSQLILKLKACYDHPEGVQTGSINFLRTNISFSNLEA